MRTLLRFGLIIAFVCRAIPSLAQQTLEIRGADSKYRFVDWSWTSPGALVVDLFYVGVPGSNEFNLGGGYAIRKGGLTVIPLVYAVLAKEGNQRGVKIAALAFYEKSGWKLNGFLGHFGPTSGDVPRYQVLDTFDATRSLGKYVDIGLSSGFFHIEGDWSPLVGPMMRLNDRRGSWAVSWRFGPEREFRIGRLLTF